MGNVDVLATSVMIVVVDDGHQSVVAFQGVTVFRLTRLRRTPSILGRNLSECFQRTTEVKHRFVDHDPLTVLPLFQRHTAVDAFIHRQKRTQQNSNDAEVGDDEARLALFPGVTHQCRAQKVDPEKR